MRSQDSTASGPTVTVSVETIRSILILEDMYQERGQVIDSLIVVIGNCDSAISIGYRAMIRERESIEACEQLRRSLVDINLGLTKDIRRSRTIAFIAGSAAVFMAGMTGAVIVLR